MSDSLTSESLGSGTLKMLKIPLALPAIWVSRYFIKAPEVMSRQNHGVAADYYAVGVIGFELMTGKVR